MEVPSDRQVFELTNSFVWFDDLGILCSLSKKPVPQTIGQVIETLQKFREITGGKKVCMLSESKYPAPPPNKQLRQLAAEEIPKITKALAYIVHSPLSKMVANLFFALYPPAYPVKMFEDEEKAKQWLKQYL